MVAWFAVCLTLPPAAAGHGDIHERVAALTKQIEQSPANADLYLKRGDLHRLHRDWDAALADYERAAQIAPGLAALDLHRGTTLLEAGWPHSAKVALDRFLVRHPDHAGARVVRARALMRLSQRAAAAEDFTRAIAQLPRPQPEHYLERAQALIAGGEERLDEALRGLDEGMEKLDQPITLQLFAIDLELKQRRYDAALERLEKISAQAARRETWLARRGEILEQAGRPAEARKAFQAALAATESLPPHRRNVKAMSELEKRLRAALERLGAD